MPATNRHPPRVPSDEASAQAREAARQLARLLPEGERPLRLVSEGDGRESISVPPDADRLFLDALTQLGQGRAVTISPGKAELTTQEVADYLNVSRPYVAKLIESGRLPALLVGTQRHISFADLIKFDEKNREARRAALDELARIDQELKLRRVAKVAWRRLCRFPTHRGEFRTFAPCAAPIPRRVSTLVQHERQAPGFCSRFA